MTPTQVLIIFGGMLAAYFLGRSHRRDEGAKR